MKIQFPYYLLFFPFFCVFFCLLVNVMWHYRPLAVVVISLCQICSPFIDLTLLKKVVLLRLFCLGSSLWLTAEKKHFAWNYLCSIFLPVCQLVGESASWRWKVTFSHVAWKRQCHRHIVITRKSGNDGSDVTGIQTVWFRQRRQQYGAIDHQSFFTCFLSSFPNSSCLTVMFW